MRKATQANVVLYLFSLHFLWCLFSILSKCLYLLIFYCIILAACLSLPHIEQMSSLHFFQEQCLRRCIQETVAGAHFLCDRCAMEAWQLLSCSLVPSLYPSLLFLPLSNQLQQRAALFVLTSPWLPADLWSTKDLDLTLATHTYSHARTHTTATAASLSFLLVNPES